MLRENTSASHKEKKKKNKHQWNLLLMILVNGISSRRVWLHATCVEHPK